jgi:DNA polymerase III psi subunit
MSSDASSGQTPSVETLVLALELLSKKPLEELTHLDQEVLRSLTPDQVKMLSVEQLESIGDDVLSEVWTERHLNALTSEQASVLFKKLYEDK